MARKARQNLSKRIRQARKAGNEQEALRLEARRASTVDLSKAPGPL
jgi:hypothetical protein